MTQRPSRRGILLGGAVGLAAAASGAVQLAQAMARQFYETFRDFPPRQRPDSFNLEGVLRQMEEPASGR